MIFLILVIYIISIFFNKYFEYYITLIFLIYFLYSDTKNRNKYFNEVIPYISKGDTILDFGSGNCDLIKFLKKRNNVINIDIYKGCENTLVYDGFNIPYPDKSFDIVFCMFVLHHIPHYKQIIKEIKRVCKKKIIIIEDYPNTNYQKLLSKLHYLYFHQSMDSIKYMNNPETWCKYLNGCVIKKVKSSSIINSTPHYIIIKNMNS